MQSRNAIPAVLLLVTLAAGCGESGGVGADPAATSSRTPNSAYVVHGESSSVTSVPSCSWPIRIVGQATPSQTGLIRGYLRALAAGSLAQLAPLAITHRDAPTTLTRADLRHAVDVRRGTTSADVTLDDSDPFDATVVLTFSGGRHRQLEMDALNPLEPASNSWRLALGRTPPWPSLPSLSGP